MSAWQYHRKTLTSTQAECSCGWQEQAVSRTQAGKQFNTHLESVTHRRRKCGPESAAKRALDVREPAPLHKMGAAN